MPDNAAQLGLYLSSSDWAGLRAFLNAVPLGRYGPTEHFAEGMWHAYGSGRADFSQAAASLELATQQAPDNLRFLMTLSELYLRAGRPAMALQSAWRARALAPADFLANLALGRAAAQCHERNLTFDCFEQAWHQMATQPPGIRQRFAEKAFGFAPFWRLPVPGLRLSLERLGRRHQDFLSRCRHDSGFQRHYHLFQDAGALAIEKDLLMAERSPLETRQVQWVVMSAGQPVGLAALVEIDFRNSHAEILLGFPERQPHAHALEAALLVMEFAFCKIGLRRLVSFVYKSNDAGQRNTLHLGFSAEGVMRSHVTDPMTGEAIDLQINGLLASDFFNNQALQKIIRRLLQRPVSDQRGVLAGRIPLGVGEDLLQSALFELF